MRVTGIVSNYTRNLNFNNFTANRKQGDNHEAYKHVPKDVFINRDTAFEKEYGPWERLRYGIKAPIRNKSEAWEKNYSSEYRFGDKYRTIYHQYHTDLIKSIVYHDSFHILRNEWPEWDICPEIELQKFGWDGDKILLLKARPAIKNEDGTKGKDGSYTIEVINNNRKSLDIEPKAELIIHPDCEYEVKETFNDDSYSLAYLKKGLEELQEIISQEECMDPFGSSAVFNDGLEDAIACLDFELM